PLNDVPEIHRAQREALRAAVEDVRRTGELGLQIVTGEPGDGKTHLLATLRAEAEASWLEPGHERVMVPIDPLRDPDAPFGHILRGLFLGLMRPLAFVPRDASAATTPLEHILWRILRRVTCELGAAGEPLCAEVASLLSKDDLSRYPTTANTILREKWAALGPRLAREAIRLPMMSPDRVDPEVWRVICSFARELVSPLVLRFLAGYSLSDDDLKLLDVDAPLDTEERAYRGLVTLLHLTDVPIVLGFDQLEGVSRLGEDAVGTFLQALGDQLYTSGGRALLLLFCQAEVWHQFLGRLQAQTRDRLLQRTPLHLGALTPALGEKLIEARLSSMWRGLSVTPPHPTFPYPEGFVRKTIGEHGLKGPRRVLSYFAQVGFLEAGSAPAAKPAREIASEQYARIRGELSHEGPRPPEEQSAITQHVVEELLTGTQSLGGARIVRAARTKIGRTRIAGIEAKIARGGKEASIYAEASNSRHGNSARSTASRLKESLEKVDKALLIRDEKIQLPPKAEAVLRQAGGRAAIVRVTDDDATSLAAIERLLNQARAGDIDVDGATAISVVCEEIAPKLEMVRKFLDAALAESSPARPADTESLVLSAIARPPSVASEAQLARAHGVPLEEISRASDELERKGAVAVQATKDGDRVVLRRPR
ncbi:MAG: hypothetical protein ACJ79U_17535, partial [Myxococcales bacterium]